MKFIATDLDQRLSDVSKVGYVELLDSASAVVQARLVLEKGVGNGCLQLPSTLPTGNYRLVAYTRYMRNEGEEVFFEKPLTVVNTFVTNEALLTDTLLPTYSFTRREGPVSVSPDRMTYDTRSGGEIRINGLPPDLQPYRSLSPGSTCINLPPGAVSLIGNKACLLRDHRLPIVNSWRNTRGRS